MAPSQKEWRLGNGNGFDSLQLHTDASIPTVGDSEVLVRFHAASLNFRDIMIAKGEYPLGVKEGVVPASDGAGTVEAVGKTVSRFKNGDKVCTLFSAGHLAGRLTPHIMSTGLGGKIDGALRQYGAYNEQSLVHMPSNLDFLQASTLVCAGLTSWNALFGLAGRRLEPGDWVLTQGTGGVSIFALQFARAAGARVIATTSSADKGERLKQLGADYVINYREDEKWGETAKKLTGGDGVQHVLEIGGPKTMRQSLNAIAMEGVITVIGTRAGRDENEPTVMDVVRSRCIVRTVLVGSRLQMEEMIRAVEANDIKPLVDEKIFSLEEAKEAYQYMWEQKHLGKLCIRID